jgi:hypothetical protein
MDAIEAAFLQLCFWTQSIAGPLFTILMVALTAGLACTAAGVTVLVLWRFFSWSARFAMLKAWIKVRSYVVSTALLYFNRLKRYGLRRVTCNIAVVCSVTVWVAIIAAFAFSDHLPEAAAVIAVMVLAFFIAGWKTRGPRARFFTFTRGFFEPTMVLAIPTFVAKSGDFAVKLFVALVKTVV